MYNGKHIKNYRKIGAEQKDVSLDVDISDHKTTFSDIIRVAPPKRYVQGLGTAKIPDQRFLDG